MSLSGGVSKEVASIKNTAVFRRSCSDVVAITPSAAPILTPRYANLLLSVSERVAAKSNEPAASLYHLEEFDILGTSGRCRYHGENVRRG